MRVKQLFPTLLLLAAVARSIFAEDLKPLDPTEILTALIGRS
jgi:hypothetical protein